MRGVGFVLYFSYTGQDHSPQQGGVSITEVTVQHAPFAKSHYVLMMAAAIVLLIHRRSAHLDVSQRIFMQA